MTTSEQMRRLEALEAQARVAALERSINDPEMRAVVEGHAREAGVDVDLLIEESVRIARHIAEVGEDAWRAECEAEELERAASFGISLERYRAIDWDAEHDAWVAAGAIPGAWRDRDWSA